MLIKKTKDMTDSERIAVENSNNQYLRTLTYAPVGMIVPFGGGTLPSAFLVCDGSAIDTTEYADLFNVIGYTYGGSDDTFNIPDLTGATVNGVSVKYIIKTANGITPEERLEILSNVDQTYNSTSENAQSGIAVAEAVRGKINKLSVSGPPFSQAVIIKPGCTGDGDTDYDAKYIDDNNWSQDNGFANAKKYIATRNDNGNLTTDAPTTDTECANKKYVDDNKAVINQTYNSTSENAQSGVAIAEALQGYIPMIRGANRSAYVQKGNGEKEVEMVELDNPDNVGTGNERYGKGFIVTRNSNGNLTSFEPKTDFEVANKAYVDALKAEISELRAMVEELKG